MIRERPELLFAIAFLVLVIHAEVALTFGSLQAGLVVHFLMLFSLIIVSSIVHSWKPVLAKLLMALILVPLIRVLSLSTPYWPFSDTLVWLAAITFPMLAASVSTIYVLKLKRSDYGFVLGPLRRLPLQFGVVLLGIPLGFLEYSILRPEPWVSDLALGSLIVGVLVIFLGTGLAEELIFRGILLHSTSLMMSWPTTILYISVIFAAMHIGFLSLADFIFVFFVGLFFAYVVFRTRTLLGVVGCHALLNIVLFIAAPILI